MPDIIQLLSDSVANQIAAGEVIQRPSSVAKELMENSIDSGATSVKVVIKDSGKTLVQVIDNGSGMSESDARLCFERHATSKIRKATDLFCISTMGFRGEALASIAAISQVRMKTKGLEAELGTEIIISASNVDSQQTVNCPVGTNISVKNLFYNIPARRKFLKSNATELKHIIVEFQRIVLSHPEISFILIHNDSEIYNLSVSNTKQRIVTIFGKNLLKNLIPIDTNTSMVKITGFIGKPEFARKTFGEQFFFVNNRFMKHPYFHKAVTLAYENIIKPDSIPSYFIFFEIATGNIDINIHPTKTEIKFEDERSIWQILQATIRETLGKFNIVPSLDFNKEGIIDIPVGKPHGDIKQPSFEIDPLYNPFDNQQKEKYYPDKFKKEQDKKNLENWEKLYSGFENEKMSVMPSDMPSSVDLIAEQSKENFFQIKNHYILSAVKSGLMIIDQKKAHERILFEKFLYSLDNNVITPQKSLFPEKIELNEADYTILKAIIEEIKILGLDISEFGGTTFVVNGTPSEIGSGDIKAIIEGLIENYKNNEELGLKIKENIARSLAKVTSIKHGRSMLNEEMRKLVDELFSCKVPNYSPGGEKVFVIVGIEEIEKKFR
ncbi:DNA mismatch repair endonuclease MutL [Bacteroidota bacterium]